MSKPRGASRDAVQPGESMDLAPLVAANLRRLRSERGLSLEKLARASGVSRAMLNQIENEQSTPTINVLWKIARALGLPFAALLSQEAARGLTVLPSAGARALSSEDGRFTSRALFPPGHPQLAEFYELRLAPGATEHAEAHAPGTWENLVVAKGRLELTVGDEQRELAQGDAAVFCADLPHAYHNLTRTETQLFLVITYTPR